jgi:hypothetical protein
VKHLLICTHPANTHSMLDWESSGIFTSLTKILKIDNNYEIEWLNTEVPF